MKTIKAKDLMVPVEDYGTVSEEATLYEAVVTLEKAQEQCDQRQYKYRSVLVANSNGHIVGDLTQWDVLRGLEPKYGDIGDLRAVSRSGLSASFTKNMLDSYSLWKKPLVDICRKATDIKVKQIMYTPAENPYVEASAPLDEAVHQLIVGNRASLLVTRRDTVVGVLRLCDVFSEIYTRTKACAM